MITDKTRPNPNIAQKQAADGLCSVWVAASAGTGKTKVLTDRVLNLLLAGTAPARILCLTFTKAAAAEMANRLNERLAQWAVIGETALRADIAGLTDQNLTTELVEQARRLFARVLDTPGGMRILTLHAFCQSVLRRFPLEAGIPPHFEVMDDRSAAELLAQAQALILNQARSEPQSDLAAALTLVTSHIGETGFAELMSALMLERGRLGRLIDQAGGLSPYLARLNRQFGLAPGEDEAACLGKICDEGAFDGTLLRRAAQHLAKGTTQTDQTTSRGLAAFLAASPAARAETFMAYSLVFLTQAGEPRKRLATQAMLKSAPWLEAVLLAEQQRIVAAEQRVASAVVADATKALTRLGNAFLAEYTREKQRRALLDYDDLILETRALLHRPGIAPWVLFKLDGGLDHIMIDEAQDTNPEQWQVIDALAAEFFTGDSARPQPRTIFAVGDAKQSIFSFQRADPHAFLAIKHKFQQRALDAKQIWNDVPLQVSFRSTPAVLDVVDAVFRQAEAKRGVDFGGPAITHEPYRFAAPGRVELWPALQPEAAVDPKEWDLPVEQFLADKARARLARLIAATIAGWLQRGEILESKNRPIRAGDILVLVRRRGGFVPELLRALKRENIAVAGADRMMLTRQLAVMDLMALGRFLLLPEDDLTLATVLKGPLIGLDETQIFTLARGRRATLWQALRQSAEPWAVAARQTLVQWQKRTDFVPPHALYAEILGQGGGRKRLIGRLGTEAADAIEEFLSQTLVYEQAHIPSLQGFLDWLERGLSEVKRDLDPGGRDEVRIMTVHGSKGLQAPIVILPDSMAVPVQLPGLLWPEDGQSMLWAPSRGKNDPISRAAKDRAKARSDEEYRRLLYVALTRAEDRLYICGWETRRPSLGVSWYQMVLTGLADLPGVVSGPITPIRDQPPLPGEGLIYARGAAPGFKTEADKAPATPPRQDGVSLPPYFRRPPPAEPIPAKPLVAARPLAEEPPTRSPLSGGPRIFQRGILIHRLLQSLPDLPLSARDNAARRFLAQRSHGLSPEAQAQIAAETLAVLADPVFAPLFGPGSRAEVPVVGLIDGRALSGRIDRLVVTASEVLVVDYKTNRPPPLDVAEVDEAYHAQLAAYRAALARIYPGKRLRTALLWTDGPRLMEITPTAPI